MMLFSPVRHLSKPVTTYLTHFRRGLHLDDRLASACVIDGKSVAKAIREEVKSEIDEVVSSGRRPPHLSVVLVGVDPASQVYVNNKIKATKHTGITSSTLKLPASVTEAELLSHIDTLNKSAEVDGILVQLPVPPHIHERRVCNAVTPSKDVDGFGVVNIGRFCVDQTAYVPATPAAVLEIIRRTGIPTFGKNAVVVGRSKNVGLPIAILLHADGRNDTDAGDATTTICHRFTPPDQLKVFTTTADIIIAAAGVPNLITADMVKPGAAVIDVGINRIKDEETDKTKLVGDVDFQGVREKAAYITPVPGGVGPVTVAMLMKNTLLAYKKDIDFELT
ncbi:bifunctional methylenetetrahydrofolate dehydrogenase/cyclohydrolase, mitochondrial-like [Haliotis rufescens]|uniref:bifunctional methylenetetrahydrofolate dehydrogenase/cyclohydrolase, mitochondrial-like n=1 Tax=Haliotis rufescens TaxID=6454 RepID=UPI001EB06C50|nr:bifunctional methylenetetrahydrofolate dehydrogenase/cyclohydrolase, mitochondrial-like [Haliotis rufescens]